jgi:hypothetical protein
VYSQPARRLFVTIAIAGSLLLLFGTWLHPMGADPNDAAAAFTEYAASSRWIAIHLIQLAGALLIATALILLGRVLTQGSAASIAAVATAGAIASAAAATILQAVDGVALKAMVERWATAPVAAKSGLFDAALAVRQIEIGLAAMTSVLFGLTAVLFGSAMGMGGRFSRWLGILAIGGGLPLAASGVVMAYQGFSGLAMDLNLSGSLLLLMWLIATGTVAPPARQKFE